VNMKTLKDLLFISIVSFFFAGVTVSVNQALSGRISLNEKTRHTRQLLDVLNIPYPASASPETLELLERTRLESGKLDGRIVYRARDEQGHPIGYAFPIGGKGFWGKIDGFLATDKDVHSIRGIIFTNHNETPGLGARIEEPWFRKQFEGLRLADAVGPRQYIQISRADESRKNTLDAITGATMTSKALEKIVNDDLNDILAKEKNLRRIEWVSRREN
jgi:Na+-transporting NADH:ubiquinone oxidoreductase subunit C